MPIECDHSDDQSVKNVFKKIQSDHNGQFDLLVNNAYAAVNVCCLLSSCFFSINILYYTLIFYTSSLTKNLKFFIKKQCVTQLLVQKGMLDFTKIALFFTFQNNHTSDIFSSTKNIKRQWVKFLISKESKNMYIV